MNKKSFLIQHEKLVYLCLGMLSIILGFIGHFMPWETIKSLTLNVASEILSVAALFFIFRKLLGEDDANLKNDKIAVVLSHGSKKLELPVELRRAEFTRAEILGRIRMMPRKDKEKPFQLSYSGTREFLQQINQIAESEGDATMIIPCTEKEFSQFDLLEK